MSQTTTSADDIAFVLGLPADRQSAVFAALAHRILGGRPDAAVAITSLDGHPAGTLVPPLAGDQFRRLVDALTPSMPLRANSPLPPGVDPGDPGNWATDEELDALTEQARARRT